MNSLNIVIPSSTYKYVKLFTPVSQTARNILSSVSGVEPALFLLPPAIDWHEAKIRKFVKNIFLQNIARRKIPLTNGAHGIRLHGFSELSLVANVISYIKDVRFSVSLLIEQIYCLNEMAKIAQVDASVYPSVLVIHLGRSSGDLDQDFQNIIDIFNQVLPIAFENNVIISLETLWQYDKDYCWGADLYDFARIFQSEIKNKESLGITFDTAHTLINYHGDYQKVTDILIKENLLQYINYLHIVPPGKKYKKYKIGKDNIWSFLPFPLDALISAIPDTHNGIEEFFALHPEDKENFLALLGLLFNKTKIREKEFNVVNLELGMRIWGTGKGATIGDIWQTMAEVKRLI